MGLTAVMLMAEPRDGYAQSSRAQSNDDLLPGFVMGGIANVTLEGVRAFVVITQFTAQMESDLAAARERFWATYPDGPGHAAARARFAELLRTKDDYYLVSELMKVGAPGDNNPNAPSFLTAAGQVDGGIPPPAQNAFIDWVNEVAQQLRIREGVLPYLSVLSQPGRARAIITAAGPQYRAYAVRRDLDEFRRAGRRPPEVDAEAWQLAALAIQADVPDPYAAALSARNAPGRFMTACSVSLDAYLGGVAPGSCACARAALREAVDPKVMWSLETRFTPEDFLLASVSRVGLHERVAACVRG